MKLQSIQAFVAPLATPLAPALIYANDLYQTMVSLDINWIIAIVAAVSTIVGMEFSGALMCHNAISAWQNNDRQKAALATIGAVLYAVIVMAGIFTIESDRAKIFGLTVLLTLVSYLAYAIHEALREQSVDRQREINNKLNTMREERLLVNAKTRQIKVGHSVQVSTGHTGQALDAGSGQPDDHPAMTNVGHRVFALLDAQPDLSARQIAQQVKCSPTTASKWAKLHKKKVDK